MIFLPVYAFLCGGCIFRALLSDPFLNFSKAVIVLATNFEGGGKVIVLPPAIESHICYVPEHILNFA